MIQSINNTLILLIAKHYRKTEAAAYGACGGLGYDLMRDANGNFLSKEDFEANLDKAIADGDITSADRGIM
ncbi:MAG TPA: hypothetical protein DDW53_18385 [Lachnoclostridium sp.]|uniref:Uncharacterized protein n=1 Tax=[Clostridium] celerecrescens 18A TaxID=1286362 RepID=A0A2M8YZU1_9FIRM|nr:hypothetical protein [Lacrimispora celerecrescens]PJJ26712.1 hypothetical protein H171_0153 [[Clostridium] celerecrescens 18A]HBE86911.1 hypothetical protein [Lachnoclostridium sp.]